MNRPLHSENIRLKQDVVKVLRKHHERFRHGAGEYAGGYEIFVAPNSPHPTVKVYYAGSPDTTEQYQQALIYLHELQDAGLAVTPCREGCLADGRLMLIVRRKTQ